MNETMWREVLARLQQIRDAHADGAHDYGDELNRDLMDEIAQMLAHRKAAGRPRPDFNPRTDYPERYSDGPY